MARIPGFHPGGPGSIPGMGKSFSSAGRNQGALSHRPNHTSCSTRGLTGDEVAEWLRRWTANPMCSARVGSNPILVGSLFLGTGLYHTTEVDWLSLVPAGATNGMPENTESAVYKSSQR